MIVDRSYSMRDIEHEAQEGVNRFISEQANLPDVKVRISLFDFDDRFEPVFKAVRAADVPTYRLVPRGNTALFDAIAWGVQATEQIVADAKHTPGKIVVVIMTDGHENCSRSHSFEQVSKIIEDKKAIGWEFVFLAGDVHAVDFGHASGLTTTSYNPRLAGQTQAVYASAAVNTSEYLTGTTRSVQMPTTVIDPDDDSGDDLVCASA